MIPGEMLPKVQAQTHAPLYWRLLEVLRQKIVSGEMSVGEALPAETELAQQYGVSRITARRAVLELVQEGLVVRYQGRGTFVRDQRAEEHSGRLTGFSEEMAASGRKPGAKLISAERMAMEGVAAERMRAAPGTFGWRIIRQRFADEQVVAYEVTWWPLLIGDWLVRQDLTGAFHQMIEQGLRIRLGKAVETITARAGNRTERSCLELPTGVPVLYVDRVTWDDRGEVNHWGASAYRADQYSYRVVLHR